MLSKIKKKIENTTFKVMYLTFIGMVLAWVFDILIAKKLGVSTEADTLIIAITIPKLIDTVAREGTRQSLVPLFMQYRSEESQKKYTNFISGCINFSIVLGFVLTIILEFLAPWIIFLLGPGLPIEAKNEATLLFRYGIPMLIFALPISIISVMLNSHKQFSVVALRNSIAPLFFIISIGLAWNQPNLSSYLVISYPLSFILFFIMVFWDAKKIGHHHNWLTWLTKEHFQELWKAGSIPTMSFLFRQTFSIIRSQVLPSLLITGGISIFYFAERMVSASQTIIGASIATTSLPNVTEKFIAGKKFEVVQILRKTILRSLLVSFPVVLMIIIFHREIIALLYGRGAFDANSITYTSQVFLFTGISLLFTCLLPILETGLYASKAYSNIAFLQVSIPIISLSLAIIFSGWQGFIGIAMSAPVVSCIYVIALIYFLYRINLSLFMKKKIDH